MFCYAHSNVQTLYKDYYTVTRDYVRITCLIDIYYIFYVNDCVFSLINTLTCNVLFQFSGKPSAMECQLSWQNSQAPTIHHGSWTAQDTKKLAALSLDKELTWHQIAEHFPVCITCIT